MRRVATKESVALTLKIHFVVHNCFMRVAFETAHFLQSNYFCATESHNIPHPSQIIKCLASQIPRSDVERVSPSPRAPSKGTCAKGSGSWPVVQPGLLQCFLTAPRHVFESLRGHEPNSVISFVVLDDLVIGCGLVPFVHTTEEPGLSDKDLPSPYNFWWGSGGGDSPGVGAWYRSS